MTNGEHNSGRNKDADSLKKFSERQVGVQAKPSNAKVGRPPQSKKSSPKSGDGKN